MNRLITISAKGGKSPKTAYTKKEAAKLLGIHYNTITKYETVAFSCVEHYEKACQINRRGEWNRNVPVTLYQIWIISLVKEMFSAIPHGYNRMDVVSERLLKDEKTSEIFSPDSFSRALPQFLKQINQQAA